MILATPWDKALATPAILAVLGRIPDVRRG